MRSVLVLVLLLLAVPPARVDQLFASSSTLSWDPVAGANRYWVFACVSNACALNAAGQPANLSAAGGWVRMADVGKKTLSIPSTCDRTYAVEAVDKRLRVLKLTPAVRCRA